ncbi:MlaE family ABC transporter permease [Comamonas terrigena]|uniref:MlaE family ABC transporter permease n=1 Tax=Comamonas terrigena TaxID=32013 RepID=UPI0023567531|nr:ABC transporter permease [Comamonas terrigena]
MTSLPPQLQRQNTPEGAWAVLQGRWGAADFGDRAHWARVQAQLKAVPAQSDLGWDLHGVDWLDHVGAQLLWQHWQGQWPARLQATPGQKAMLQRVERFTAPPATIPKPHPVREAVESLGCMVIQGREHLLAMVQLVGQLLLDVLRLLRAPLRGPWRDVSGHLYNMGAMALPITALVGFLIGVVLAYLMSLQLRQFGAEAFIVNILGISLIRELGPLLGAILVAGRTGSAITAQIGVMRVTEELDAMQVMGIPQGYRLVMPRALALALAMPLISLWTTLAALAGGMLAADMTMGISAAYFLQSLPDAVNVGNLWLAMGKSVVFGVFIALIGCHWGLRVEPNTQSLGQGTTASVVTAITMVIVVDAVFAILFRNVGF